METHYHEVIIVCQNDKPTKQHQIISVCQKRTYKMTMWNNLHAFCVHQIDMANERNQNARNTLI